MLTTNRLLLSEEEFFEQYTLQQNTINPNSNWNGCFFTNYHNKVELDFLKYILPENRVWSIMSGGQENDFLVNGMNKKAIGFLVTEESYDPTETIMVEIAI